MLFAEPVTPIVSPAAIGIGGDAANVTTPALPACWATLERKNPTSHGGEPAVLASSRTTRSETVPEP